MIHGRIRKRTGLIRSSVGRTMEQVLQAAHEGSSDRTHQHAKPLQKKDHNPSSFNMEVHLNFPRKRNNWLYCCPQLVVAEAEHLKDIRIHIHF